MPTKTKTNKTVRAKKPAEPKSLEKIAEPQITLATQEFVTAMEKAWEDHYNQMIKINLNLKKQCEDHLMDLQSLCNNLSRMCMSLFGILALDVVVIGIILFAILKGQG